MVLSWQVAVKEPQGLCGDLTRDQERGSVAVQGKVMRPGPAQSSGHSSGAGRDN